MKSLFACIIQRYDLSSSLFVGGVMCLMASIFLGSGSTPSLEIVIPHHGILGWAIIHLLGFSVIPASLILLHASSSATSCSSFDLPATIRSSCITCTCGQSENNGHRARVSSPVAGHDPMVRRLYLISFPFAWNTVMSFDGLSSCN